MARVREYSVPALTTDGAKHGTADYVFDGAARHPEHIALRRQIDGAWVDVTSATFATEVTDIARGLIANNVKAGDRVAVMSRTRYEWTAVDFAIFAVGGVCVPIYETSSAEQVEWILSNSAAVAAFAESAKHAAVIDSVRPNSPALGPVWVFDDGGLAELTASGADVPADQVEARRRSVTFDDLASIIYTSGTTGRPKGCELTHGNFVAEVEQLLSGGLSALFNTEGSTLLFIPIAHVFGRAIHIGAIANGVTLGHTPDVKDLVADLGTFQPRFVLSVPRVFEKVFNTARQKAQSDGKGKIFDLAAQTAIDYSKALGDSGRGAPKIGLKLKHAVFDKLVYSKLRAALGGRCEAAISGGAPLGERLGHFYRGIGVTIYEGYGLTESTAGACVNLVSASKIANDGELLMRGLVVFRGYWQNPDATAEAIDGDGWFHTGDIGEIDEDGFVRITGRKKELIVTAAGKNVAPAVLEDRLRAHWLVGQCLVVGDQQPFIAALITIDSESLPTWLERNSLPADTSMASLVDNETLRAEIQLAVDDANKAVSRAESIREFVILPEEWTEAGGQITPSLKLKRNVVLKENAAEIERIYAGVERF
jgi:long-chain acyl-CoA synthetase